MKQEEIMWKKSKQIDYQNKDQSYQYKPNKNKMNTIFKET